MSDSKEIEQVWSVDEEVFRWDSLDELLENEEIGIGATVFVGEKLPHDHTHFCDADDIIEMIGERAYDRAGEFAEDYPDVTKEAHDELDIFLREWMNKHCTPTFYAVKNVQKHIVTTEDLESIQL